MKKITFFCLISVLCALSLTAQTITIPETQQSLITKRTADWCSNCGSWGWALFKNLVEDNNDKAVVVAAHSSGGLQNPTSTAWLANLGGGGQPRFFLDNDNQSASSSSIAAARANFEQAVDERAAMSPVVQVGVEAYYNNANEFVLMTQAQFFQEATGEFSIGVFLIQKEFVSSQSGQGSSAVHEQLLTTHLTDEALGTPLASGTFQPGDVTDLQEFRMPIGDYDPENVEFAVVIWKQEGDNLTFVNANTSQELLLVNSNEVVWEGANVKVLPNITADLAQMELSLTTATEVRATLLDSGGRLVETLFTEEARAGLNSYQLDLSKLAAGNYYLSLESKSGRIVEKVVVVQ